MSIDPRLIERRRTVAEDNAKRNVSRLLKFLAVALVVAGVVWVVFSPWLSVSLVQTSGVSSSTTNAILADRGVTAGTPMIRLSPGAVEAALLEDPWVAEATVELHWPDRVIVDVIERTPVAWALTGSGWARRALDGVALPSADVPDDEMARIEMTTITDDTAGGSVDLLGALEFVAALPLALHPGTVVSETAGEVWATVAGYQVRLGRPVDMTEKALSLSALVNEQLPAGSTLVLIAPTNPAVMTPGETDASVADPPSDDAGDDDQGADNGDVTADDDS